MRILLVAVLAASLLAGAAFAGSQLGAKGAPERAAAAPAVRDPQLAALLRTGQERYDAYVRAELASLRDRERAGDEAGARIHRGRVAPATAGGERRTEPVAVVRAAARLLSLDARHTGDGSLLDIESHAAGAGAAFDALRDALWSLDQGLVGSIDERLATVRDELDRHRRGNGFADTRTLTATDRRRLGAALDALAWRLDVAADKLAAA